MFRPPNNFVMVAAGAVTTDDLLERIVSGAQRAGWISKQEFDKTRKTLDSTIDTNGQNFNPADLNDPNRMTQILRELTRQKYQQQGR